MDKRDKVITGFMCLLSCTTPNDCSECGYECNTAIHVKTPVNMIFDAITLLKVHEPKMVIGIAEIYKDILLGNCPSCDQSIVSNVNKPTKYCRFCGQAVKWIERE